MRRLFWKSYLNPLDRKMFCLSCLPEAERKNDKNLVRIASLYGERRIFRWMRKNGYRVARLYDDEEEDCTNFFYAFFCALWNALVMFFRLFIC